MGALAYLLSLLSEKVTQGMDRAARTAAEQAEAKARKAKAKQEARNKAAAAASAAATAGSDAGAASDSLDKQQDAATALPQPLLDQSSWNERFRAAQFALAQVDDAVALLARQGTAPSAAFAGQVHALATTFQSLVFTLEQPRGDVATAGAGSRRSSHAQSLLASGATADTTTVGASDTDEEEDDDDEDDIDLSLFGIVVAGKTGAAPGAGRADPAAPLPPLLPPPAVAAIAPASASSTATTPLLDRQPGSADSSSSKCITCGPGGKKLARVVVPRHLHTCAPCAGAGAGAGPAPSMRSVALGVNFVTSAAGSSAKQSRPPSPSPSPGDRGL